MAVACGRRRDGSSVAVPGSTRDRKGRAATVKGHAPTAREQTPPNLDDELDSRWTD